MVAQQTEKVEEIGFAFFGMNGEMLSDKVPLSYTCLDIDFDMQEKM